MADIKTAFSLFLIIVLVVAGYVLFRYVFLPLAGEDLGFFGKKGGGGIFKSQDGGENWRPMIEVEGEEKANIGKVFVSDLVFGPQNSNILYLAAGKDGLFRSENRAETWQKIGEGLKKGTLISKIAIDPQNPQNIYLAVFQDKRGKVLKSHNKGETFEEIYLASEKEEITAISVDSYEPFTVYLGTSNGFLLQSRDFGKSWKSLFQSKNSIKSILINPKDTREIYIVVSREGLFKTLDKGNTWQDFNKTLKLFSGSKSIETIAIDTQSPNRLYLSYKGGILKTENKGESFESLPIVISKESLPVSAIAVDSLNSHILYLGTGSDFYKSQDQGQHWIVKTIPTSKKIKIIKVDPRNSQNIYVGTGG